MAVKIFFCYAREDEELLNKLKAHLKPLQRKGLIDVWYDRDISAGTEWEQQIKEQLNSAQIILLLVSPDFMNSDYCYGIEMQRAIQRHERGEARVIPIILRPVLWKVAPFSKIQSLPKDGKPIVSRDWHSQDEAFLVVVEHIQTTIEQYAPILAQEKMLQILEKNRKVDLRNKSFTRNNDSPYVKLLCPYCIQWFYLGDCEIVSKINPDKILLHVPDDDQRHNARLNPASLTDPKYAQELASRRCPNCKNLLPSSIESADNVSIAIVGDIGSGKSSFIALLVHLLQEGAISAILRFIPINQNIDNKYQNVYFKPLFLHKQALKRTPVGTKPIRYPLMYELFLQDSSVDAGKHINLIIYDSSGEDYLSQERIIEFNKFILYADAIIYLADPLSMPGILRQLPSSLQPIEPSSRKASYVLNIIMQIFERNNDPTLGLDLFSKPIAITISKSDLLKFLMDSSSSTTLFPYSQRSYSVDMEDFKMVNREVMKIIGEFGDHILLNTSKFFQNISFFAVSATGWPTDPQNNFPSIEPIRCLDPLLWIFHELKII